MEKVQWNSIDKKQNGLKYSKNDKSSTPPPRHHNTSLIPYIESIVQSLYKPGCVRELTSTYYKRDKIN